MAVPHALLNPLLSLFLISTATALGNPNEAIKTECNISAKDPKLCIELLSTHLDCNTGNVTGVAELSMQVAAKVAREADAFARAKVAEAKGATPSLCVSNCVRDICLVAHKLEAVEPVITYGVWIKVGLLLNKHQTIFKCGNECPEKPTANEQALVQRFTVVKNTLSVMKDLMDARGNHEEEFPKIPGMVDY